MPSREALEKRQAPFPLVDKATEWPGLTSADAVIAGENMTFRKVNWTEYHLAKRKHPKVRPEDFIETHELELTPLPAWEGMSPEEQRAAALDAIRSGEIAAREKRQAEGKTVMSRKKLLRTNPSMRSKNPKRSHRPLCHTSRPELYQAFKQAWRDFCDAYYEASIEYRNGKLLTIFPKWSIRPPLLDVS